MKKQKKKGENKYNLNTKLNIILEISLTDALSLILSCFTLFKMPFGGAVTLASGCPIIVLSFRRGAKVGFVSGLIYGILQIVLGFHFPPVKKFFSLFLVILLDYLLPYSSLGLANIFYKIINYESKKHKELKYDSKAFFSSIIVCSIRYISSVLSGIIVWGSLVPKNFNVCTYSILYNLVYMLPETIITAIMSSLVCRNKKL